MCESARGHAARLTRLLPQRIEHCVRASPARAAWLVGHAALRSVSLVVPAVSIAHLVELDWAAEKQALLTALPAGDHIVLLLLMSLLLGLCAPRVLRGRRGGWIQQRI